MNTAEEKLNKVKEYIVALKISHEVMAKSIKSAHATEIQRAKLTSSAHTLKMISDRLIELVWDSKEEEKSATLKMIKEVVNGGNE